MFSSIVKVITGWVRLRGATDDTFIGNTSDSLKTNVTNGSGASSVNIQDGGNSLTVDQATAANFNATVRNQDGSGNNITSLALESHRGFHVAQLEAETFTVISPITAIGNNKSMVSILNAGGSGVTVKIREIYLINTQNTSITGVIADFRLFRMTGHSAGISLTPEASDSDDTLNVNVTARTGATIAGESANYSRRWLWSSDEWGTGASDVEANDHASQNLLTAYQSNNPKIKPITLNAGQGIHIKHVVNSTAGTFDLVVVFTQE